MRQSVGGWLVVSWNPPVCGVSLKFLGDGLCFQQRSILGDSTLKSALLARSLCAVRTSVHKNGVLRAHLDTGVGG